MDSPASAPSRIQAPVGPLSDSIASQDPRTTAPEFELAPPEHQFACRDDVFFIDRNGFDVFQGTITEVTANHYVVRNGSHEEKIPVRDRNRLLRRTTVNIMIWEAQEKVRDQAPAPAEIDDGNWVSKRLRQGLNPRHTSWDDDSLHDYTLDGWPGFTDDEIQQIWHMLHDESDEQEEEEDAAVGGICDDEACLEEESSAETVDMVAGGAPLKEKLAEFQIEAVTVSTRTLFLALMATEEWQRCASYRDQVNVAVTALHFGPGKVSFHQIGRLFGKNAGTVSNIYEKSLRVPRPSGRPPVLSPDLCQAIMEFVSERFESSDPARIEDILDFLMTRGTTISPDTLRHNLRSITGLKTVKGKPMEEDRVSVDPHVVQDYFAGLRREIVDIPACMLMNLDESGFQEWADRKDVRVVVPSVYSANEIQIPCKRGAKRASMLGCIAADGSSLVPLIIVPRKTIEVELFEVGYTPDKVLVRFQENGFISAALFDEWVHSILVPAIHERRQKIGYTGWAVVLLDGCTAHFPDVVLDACLEHGILFLPLPAHASDQLQPLDLGIFAIQKGGMGRVHPGSWLNTQTQQICHILGAWIAAATPPNITSAFAQAGITVHYSAERQMNLANCRPEFAGKVRLAKGEPSPTSSKQRMSVVTPCTG
jgi:hypothetical protein